MSEGTNGNDSNLLTMRKNVVLAVVSDPEFEALLTAAAKHRGSPVDLHAWAQRIADDVCKAV